MKKARLRKLVYGGDPLDGTNPPNPYTWGSPNINGNQPSMPTNPNATKPYSVDPIQSTPVVLGNMNSTNPTSTASSPTSGSATWSKIGTAATTIAPYATNIANMFRRPAPVPAPHLNNPISLQRINMNNDRNMVEAGVRGSDLNADRTLDENTSQSVKEYNLSQRFNQLSQVNQSESNQNIEISNKENLTNADIAAGNNAKLDNRDFNTVDRTNTIQTQSSANAADAANKYMAIGNEQAKRDLDKDRFAIIQQMYNRDGVAGRQWKSLEEMKTDPIGLQYYNSQKAAGISEDKIIDQANADYKQRKDEMATLLLDQKKYGGVLKYRTGGMMKVFSN